MVVTVLSPRTLSSPSTPGRPNTSTFSRLAKLTWMDVFQTKGLPYEYQAFEAPPLATRALLWPKSWHAASWTCSSLAWSPIGSPELVQVTNTIISQFGDLPVDCEADCEGKKSLLLLEGKRANKHRVDIHSWSLIDGYYQGAQRERSKMKMVRNAEYSAFSVFGSICESQFSGLKDSKKPVRLLRMQASK